MAVGLSDSPATFFALYKLFLPCCTLNDCRRAARSFSKTGRLFSLFLCCLFLARLFIFLLLLMSGNVYPHLSSIFSGSVCAGNMTCSGRSVHCCTWSKWVHFRCSLLSFSRFKTFGNSHSWSCLPCCVSASSGSPTHTNTVSSSVGPSSLYIFTVQPGPSSYLAHWSIWPPLRMQRSRHTLIFKPSNLVPPTSYLLSLHPPHPLMFRAVFLYFLLPPLTRLGFFNGMLRFSSQKRETTPLYLVSFCGSYLYLGIQT